MKDGVAQRIDLHGNVITTIRGNSLEEHLGRFGGSTRRSSNDDLIKVFSDFNSCMPFKKWLSGKVAIAGMRDASWPKWRETEWPGWYLEYKFSTYLAQRGVRTVSYVGNSGKKQGALDFDLYFPYQKFYGDLKASDEAQKDSPGNDQMSLMEAINKFDRFWYVIYEHETVKDKECGGEVCKFRYEG